MKKQFSEEQNVRILWEGEVLGVEMLEICRRDNLTEQTFFR